jgi:hypothetical protein
MLISTHTETAKQTEAIYIVDDQPYKGREYIGSAPKPGTPGYGQDVVGEEVPQAYLVFQPPHSVTRPHFHQTNQFQIFVEGGGTVGKLRVDPLTVQYAGGNTPYGPIMAEAEGIRYFTLRQTWDSGAKYLPANRNLLVKGRQRQVVGVKENKMTAETSGANTETLIEATADGLFAQNIVLTPKAKYSLPDTAEGGGQYHVVVSGSLTRNGGTLPPLSVEFAPCDEGVVEIEAGPDGLELLLARFPKGRASGNI